jgi:Rieske [2Fe-2S] domain
MRARSTAWHDAARPDRMTRHVVAPVDELPPGTRKFLTVDGRPIAVFNIKGEFFGLLNRCPHQGAALCEGAADRARAIVRSRRDRIHQARRNHPLPLARLGIRYPHRPILLRPEAVPGQGLSRQCRVGLERGEGPLRGGDHRGVGGKRLRGGGFVKPSNAGVDLEVEHFGVVENFNAEPLGGEIERIQIALPPPITGTSYLRVKSTMPSCYLCLHGNQTGGGPD